MSRWFRSLSNRHFSGMCNFSILSLYDWTKVDVFFTTQLCIVCIIHGMVVVVCHIVGHCGHMVLWYSDTLRSIQVIPRTQDNCPLIHHTSLLRQPQSEPHHSEAINWQTMKHPDTSGHWTGLILCILILNINWSLVYIKITVSLVGDPHQNNSSCQGNHPQPRMRMRLWSRILLSARMMRLGW